MSGSLDRRRFIFLSTLAAANAAVPRSMAETAAASRHWDGYDKAILIDALGSPGGGGGPLTAAQIADVRSSGLTAVNLTVGALGSGADVFAETFRTIGDCEQVIDAHPDLLLRIRSAADLARAKESRRLGIIYGFQDATPLGDDPGRVEMFKNFGVRVIQLTYNRRNLLGDGCLETANAGLSRLGQQVVERMNDLGVLVDLSHCGHRTTLDGIAASKKPVAITHAGCAAVADLPRNKTDEEASPARREGRRHGDLLHALPADEGAADGGGPDPPRRACRERGRRGPRGVGDGRRDLRHRASPRNSSSATARTSWTGGARGSPPPARRRTSTPSSPTSTRRAASRPSPRCCASGRTPRRASRRSWAATSRGCSGRSGRRSEE